MRTSPRQFSRCLDFFRAPDGCLQYHTGPGGRITSFNGGFAGAQTIVNQQYNICLRQELGKILFLSRKTLRIKHTKDVILRKNRYHFVDLIRRLKVRIFLFSDIFPLDNGLWPIPESTGRFL